MTTKTTTTQDAQAIEAALRKLESDHDIGVDNDLHVLLNDMFAKYRDTLGIDPAYTAGGGTDKSAA